jgi:hypothetical protein
MNKKVGMLIGVALLVVALATSVLFASPGKGPGDRPAPPQLTAEQTAMWKDWHQKNFELRKEYVGNLVKMGTLKQEDADSRLKMMQMMQDYKMKYNLVGPGQRGKGRTALTDEQKVDLQKIFDARVELATKRLDTLVKDGKLTQAQADARIVFMKAKNELQLQGGNAGFGDKGGKGRGHRFQ